MIISYKFLQNEFENSNNEKLNVSKSNVKEVDEEEVAAGKVSIWTYWKYFRAGKSISMLIILSIGFLVVASLSSFCDYWLAQW